MNNASIIINKVKIYARHQGFIDFSTYLIFTLATVLLAILIALFLLKSPLYGLIGIVPIFFYRHVSLIRRARELEKKADLNGQLVNSIQLSLIPENSKERYSQELIDAFINESAKKIKDVDSRKYLSFGLLNRVTLFFLVVVATCLAFPAFFPGRFWYAFNHKIAYLTLPKEGYYDKGAAINLKLSLFSPYRPKKVELIISYDNRTFKEMLDIKDGIVQKKLTINEPLTYHFEFFDLKTDDCKLSVIEPIFIKNLEFYLEYPGYTKLKNDIKTTRQLVAPTGTKVSMKGQASQPLNSGQLEFNDTIGLEISGNDFSCEFKINKSGTAILHLAAGSELKEPISIYAIPDLGPLVDIFYPGYNINLPHGMKITIGIRCGDDYGLQEANFFYKFKSEQKKPLKLKKSAVEDTIYFDWDLSETGMLPGDEVSYYVQVRDNAGNVTKSKTYYIYFPTMEQMYQEVSEKENLIQADLKDMQTEHTEEMKEIMRIEEKIMKERELSWLDKEKLKEAIGKEEKILDKIDQWQQELEKTIEKLNEGIVLDQESIERLQEITKILQEIAPEELRQALENLQFELNKKPEDIKKALEQLKQAQEELAKALERTLEILRRYQQEEKLKELAKMAKDLAEKANELDKLMAKGEDPKINEKMAKLNQAIDSLANEIRKLAKSSGLEQEIKEALENLSQKTSEISANSETPIELTEQDLNKLAAELERLYESLTKGRSAKLRKNLLETLNQLIEISKQEEDIYQGEKVNAELQDQIINATRAVADSIYGQQVKSLYVTPGIGKGLARAIKEMEQVCRKSNQGQEGKDNAKEAMRQINLVCLEILESLKRGAEGGSSTGMDQFLKDLANISQGQMSLNQSLLSIFPIPVSGLTGEQMAQLRRLAGRQRELREALEALGDEPGASKYQQLIDNLSAEMKEMEEALYQYKLDRKLIERQKMIISRLLDAQKSIRQEDYQKERKSKPGEDILQAPPIPLPSDLGVDELRAIIQKALKEPYPEEYELYIREYFKSLLEEYLQKNK